ncbi:hypothetical protein LTR72_012030 [Exophiala xenobiotica]|nr:hypothetical protein LTR72_012030 [Exophiala xenobiotica]KAK5282896.1 hypothetical protein LTR14_011961 [Exophiala xenobiotica]KAK5455813.1 hypothetical protein LTR55_012079 [Exophiala xenobiotica]
MTELPYIDEDDIEPSEILTRCLATIGDATELAESRLILNERALALMAIEGHFSDPREIPDEHFANSESHEGSADRAWNDNSTLLNTMSDRTQGGGSKKNKEGKAGKPLVVG